MTFDENGICVLESITSPDECEAYKAFLLAEGKRHRDELVSVVEYADRLREIDTIYTKAAAEFYDSAAKRHADDLDAIAKRIPEIEAHKAKLEGK
jgi:hypothetical protein